MYQLPINIIYGQLIVIFIGLFVIFPSIKILLNHNKVILKSKSWGVYGVLLINIIIVFIIWCIV